jgi:PKD repeat protein
MAGPIYHFDAANPSTTKFPAGFEGQFFAGEFGRRFIKPIHVNADGSVGAIESLPWAGTQVMDMQFGPDGALYVLDYGAGFGNGDANSALYRIDFIGQGANRAPIAVAAGNPTSGTAPLTVAFSSAGSSDPDGNPITFSWAFGDGATSTAANPSHTYTANGNFTATLTVRDNQGATGTASVPITVGNTAPRVTLTTPTNGQLFSFGDTVPFTITVTDPEDGPISCSRVHLTYILGHDTHGHQITTVTGCTGSITTPVDGEHDAAANIFGVFDADYTDNGGITTHTQNILQPRHRQAEHFGTQSGGVQVATHAAAEGGATAGFIDNNDWISFQPYNLSNATQFTARVASGGPGGTIEVRSGSATGPLHGTATVPNTGGWETYTNVTAGLTGVPSGPTQLYLVFKGGAGNLFDVDAFTFTTGGTPPTGISTLKSMANNQFVSAANATTALIANKATVGATERFDVIDLGGGNIALRSRANNMYVTAENAGAQPLIANRAAVGAWETFALIRNTDGTESLRAGANNMYVVAENAGAQSLIANRAAIGAWEKFDLVTS